MHFTSLPSENVALASVIAPGALTAGAKNSGWIDLALYQQLCAILSFGVFGASGTADGKWQVADDSSGTNPVDVTGGNGALTQVLKAGGDNKQVIHNLDANKITNTGKRFARYVMTIGTATSDAAGIILGFQARHLPATDNDSANVVQVV